MSIYVDLFESSHTETHRNLTTELEKNLQYLWGI